MRVFGMSAEERMGVSIQSLAIEAMWRGYEVF